jgi:hypothetical protein
MSIFCKNLGALAGVWYGGAGEGNWFVSRVRIEDLVQAALVFNLLLTALPGGSYPLIWNQLNWFIYSPLPILLTK